MESSEISKLAQDTFVQNDALSIKCFLEFYLCPNISRFSIPDGQILFEKANKRCLLTSLLKYQI